MARQPAAHSRIHDHFVAQIRQGMFEDGKRLPTEAEIADDFGVSRATVQFAMSRLAWEGWIERFPGRGTFVSARERKPDRVSPDVLSPGDVPKSVRDAVNAMYGLDNLGGERPLVTTVAVGPDGISFGQDEKPLENDKGGTNSNVFYRLMSFGRLAASEDISEQLGIEKNTWIFQLERSKYAATRMVEIERHYFAPHVFPKFDTEDMEVLSARNLFIASRIGEAIDRVEVTMKTMRLPLNELSLRSVFSEIPDFTARWFSEDEKLIVVTKWTIWSAYNVILY